MEFSPPGRKKVAVSGVSTILYLNAYRWIHERDVIPVRHIFEKADRRAIPVRYIFNKGRPRGYPCESLLTKFINNENEK